ncbi:MAG: hypothetical protein FJ035_05310 [Chloroflexi bacterium]|nr:hypothetical protein [Chloroflexota bacterium]
MCTMIVEQTALSGSAKGALGWFPVAHANVAYDHPFHAPLDHALMIDFVNPALGLDARVSVELTPATARALVAAVKAALARGEEALAALAVGSTPA